jgi:threonine/homoserine/homoserine lactone efflux protein
MVVGILFAVGLGQVLQKAGGAFADRLINPENIDYVISLVIGLVLSTVAVRMIRKPAPDPSKGNRGRSGPDGETKSGLAAPFLTGIGSNAIAGPAMLISFAAFGQILKAEFSVPVTLLVLAYYNLLVISPLVFFVWLSAVNRERADRFFESMRARAGGFGRKLIPILCLIIGSIMIADSIGFFFGHPLLPMGAKPEVAATPG